MEMGSSNLQNKIRFQIHPRVFAALGEDLVTNDVVAALELVKNSYDAMATQVDVKFEEHPRLGMYLEIKDDGLGMDRETIEQAWCMVATPYRKNHPIVSRGKRIRRAAGEKGLGRLSAARLGTKLRMVTKADSEPCWMVKVNWSDLARAQSLDNCVVTCIPYHRKPPFPHTGTRVRIYHLHSDWRTDQISDLHDNLARLISPFSTVNDFKIQLSAPDTESEQVSATEIEAPQFLQHPPYAIQGMVTDEGQVKAHYEFRPIGRKGPRNHPVKMTWKDIRKNSEITEKLDEGGPGCGPFEFEIRAWDIGSEDTQEIAEHFDIAKGNIRRAIRAHKGISVYRDCVLALPKSDENRDWLGLDLRRISRVGTRLSTSQVVGYVSITAQHNAKIQDTSDREGLARNSAVLAFQEILKATVAALEAQRDEDRLKPGDEVKLQALLDGIAVDDLIEEVSAIAEEGGTAQEALVCIRGFSAKLELVREALKKRLVYYSRLATVGTIAQMLVHEIRNRTTAIARFLKSVRENEWTSQQDKDFRNQLALAEDSVRSLEKLADTFAPLASRNFRRGRRDAILEENIAGCIDLLKRDIDEANVDIEFSKSTDTRVAVDPGELHAVILNLLTNALYWAQEEKRKPRVEIKIRRSHKGDRARVTISDSGPGVKPDDARKIFLPGVTRKAGGIGMGLTVAAEIVSEYGGQLGVEPHGMLGGATFTFDLPLRA
jgi:signal transduction histidine kinase